MPFQLQSADIANMLRWGCDLRGSLQIGIDEHAVPVLLVGDLDVPGVLIPRQGEWVTAHETSTGAAGFVAHVAFSPESPEDFFVARYVIPDVDAAGIIRVFKLLRSSLLGPFINTRSARTEREVTGDLGGLQHTQEVTIPVGGEFPFFLRVNGVQDSPKIQFIPPFVVRPNEALFFEFSTLLATMDVTLIGQLYRLRGVTGRA